jgi:hypothetical protein
MVSRIEPDRYADTGFAVKDTPPEINARLFAAMMRKTPQERLSMAFDMMATARQLVWASLAGIEDEDERRAMFYRRFYGEELPEGFPRKIGSR